MKITAVEPILLGATLPPDQPIRWSGGELLVLPTLLVQVQTDEGLSGLGDCYALGCFAPEAGAAIVRHFETALLGQDPREVERLCLRLWRSSLYWGRSGAGVGVISTIENALWDIKGKALGHPVHALLGGAVHEKLPLYASGGLERPDDELAAELRGYVAEGFGTVKIRIGYNAERDRAKVALAREVLGPGVRLGVDAVQGHNPEPWSAAEAIRVARAIEAFDIAWFEEPCANYDYDGYATVRQATRMPISGGESSSTIHEFRHFFSRGALDIAQPDAVSAGGIAECLRIAALADAHGVKIAPHAWGTAACNMANYHFGFATPNCVALEYPTYGNPLRDALLVEPLQIVEGHLLPPRVPGLGVHLPDEVRARYPYQPGTQARMRRGT
jgi:L-alanine-DL-glutamate epimerase-like enolase superfamily enzyme